VRPLLAPASRHPGGERLQVLGDGGEVELVAGTGEASQPQAIEAVMGLQMGNAHFDRTHPVSAQESADATQAAMASGFCRFQFQGSSSSMRLAG
jgi:hypothetical protein